MTPREPAIWLLQASPRDPLTGAIVPVKLAGGGKRGYAQFGSRDWRAGLGRPPAIVQKLGFTGAGDENGFGEGAIVQALSFEWRGRAKDSAALAALYWRDAAFTLHAGPDGGDDAAMMPIMVGRIADCLSEPGGIKLNMVDPALDLDKPVLSGTFLGTGDLEGDVELKGQTKWRGWGRLFNVTLRSLERASNIWVATDPAQKLQGIDQVYDRGNAASSLTTVAWAGSSAATLAALRATVCPQGGAAVAPSIACIKWWFANPGRLTVDLSGEIGGAYVDRPADIAAALVAVAGGPTINTIQLNAARTARNEKAGWLVEDPAATIAGELTGLLSGVSLWWALSATGQIELGEWAWGASVASFKAAKVERAQSFQPVNKVALGWKPNRTVMARGDIAAGVVEERFDAMADPAKLAMAEKRELISWDAETLVRHNSVIARAGVLGINTTAAATALATWTGYRGGLTPAWNDVTQDTVIVRATYAANRTGWTAALDALDVAISTEDAARANWSTVTNRPPVTGSAVSVDEFTADLTRWTKNGDVTSIATPVPVYSRTAFRFGPTPSNPSVIGEYVPFDRTAQYSVECEFDRSGNPDGNFFLGVSLKDAAGTIITGDGSYWLYAYRAASQQSAAGIPDHVWRHFGAGTDKEFPTNAVSMAPLVLCSFSATTGHYIAEGARISKLSAPLEWSENADQTGGGATHVMPGVIRGAGYYPESVWARSARTLTKRRSIRVSGKPLRTDRYQMLGLTDSTGFDYSHGDYVLYSAPGALQIYESGSYIGNFGTTTTQDTLTVEYDGGQVRYYKNDSLLRTIWAGANREFWGAAYLYQKDAGFSSVSVDTARGMAVVGATTYDATGTLLGPNDLNNAAVGIIGGSFVNPATGASGSGTAIANSLLVPDIATALSVGGAPYRNKNANFAIWPNPAAPPDGWVHSYGTPAMVTRVAGDTGGFACDVTVNAGQIHEIIYAEPAGSISPGWFEMVMDYQHISGSLTGAGNRLYVYNASGTYLDSAGLNLATNPDINGTVIGDNPAPGRYYFRTYKQFTNPAMTQFYFGTSGGGLHAGKTGTGRGIIRLAGFRALSVGEVATQTTLPANIAVAGTTAQWIGVTGSGRPADNATNDRFLDTRNSNQLPSWYRATYSERTASEFKDGWALAVPGAGGNAGYYGALETIVDYNHVSGGVIKQRFVAGVTGSGMVSGQAHVRVSIDESNWGPWTRDYSGYLRPSFGDNDLLESGSTVATLANFRTSTGTAAAIAGQGSLATRNTARLGVELADDDGSVLDRRSVRNNFYDSARGITRVDVPIDGHWSFEGSATGAIRVDLPFGPAAQLVAMVTMTVEIFDYNGGTPNTNIQTYTLSGYVYYPSPAWYASTAKLMGGGGTARAVRFGRTGSRWAIWIGEPGGSWNYPKVTIRDVRVGYSGLALANWESGWAIGVDPAAATNVDNHVASPNPGDAIFGVNALEGFNGAVATLANFRTGLGIAAAIAGQGSGATASSLSQLNTGEGAKLATIEMAADVTMQVNGGKSVTVSFDYTGTAKAGQLPVNAPFQLVRGIGTDVTSSASWTASLKSGLATFSIGATTGVLTVSALLSDAVIEVTAAYLGSLRKNSLSMIKSLDPPPQTGGAGGTTASSSTISATSGSVYGAANTPLLTVKTGSAGRIDFTCPADFYRLSNGTSYAFGKWQWRAVGGTMADVAAEVGADFSAFTNTGDFTYDPGHIEVTMSKTGLAIGTNYEVHLFLRGSTAGTLNWDGTATAVGS